MVFLLLFLFDKWWFQERILICQGRHVTTKAKVCVRVRNRLLYFPINHPYIHDLSCLSSQGVIQPTGERRSTGREHRERTRQREHPTEELSINITGHLLATENRYYTTYSRHTIVHAFLNVVCCSISIS